MRTFRFFDFPVYKAGKIFYKNILAITQNFSDYNLKDQVKRAALSIILNIAEGSAMRSDKEFARYLEKSLGSVNEVAACIDIMLDNKLISERLYMTMLSQAETIAKQLGGLKKSLMVKS